MYVNKFESNLEAITCDTDKAVLSLGFEHFNAKYYDIFKVLILLHPICLY